MLQRVSTKVFSTSDVYRFALDNGIERLVLTKESATHYEILLCGVLKITYEYKTEKINFFQIKYRDFETKVWTKMSSKLKRVVGHWIGVYFTPGQCSDKQLFRTLIEESITILINNLLSLGASIEDKADVYILTDCCNCYELSCVCSPVEKLYLKSQQFMEGNVDSSYVSKLKNIKVNFNVTANGIMNFEDDRLASDIHFNKELLTKFLYLTFHNESAWFRSGKLLYKATSVIFNKDLCRKMLRVYSGRYFAHFNLNDYISFRNKYRLDNVNDNLLSLLRDDNNKNSKSAPKKIFYDGSNESMLSCLAANGYDVSRSEIKLFRKLPVTLVRLGGLAIQLQRNDPNRICVLNLLKDKRCLQKLPVKYINQIGSQLLSSRFKNVCADSVKFIFKLWFDAKLDFFKKYSFLKHRDEWDKEHAVLMHALDWLVFTNPLLNKNQEWSSILRQIFKWDVERHSLKSNKIPNYTWPSLSKGQEYEFEGVHYSEILTTRELFIEGEVLRHCVYDYSELCINHIYRVFTVSSKTERATLGIDCQGKELEFDQIYAEDNIPPSPDLQKKARIFVNLLNKKGSK